MHNNTGDLMCSLPARPRPSMGAVGASTTISALVFLQMLGHPPAVAEAGTRGSLRWRGSRHFGLTIGVEGIVEGCDKGQLLLVIRGAELESSNQGIQPRCFVAPGAAWGHICIPDDPAHFH